jgi:hypothetical protein
VAFGEPGRIGTIDVTQSDTNSNLLKDIWIETHKGERIKLLDMTPAMMVERGAKEWKGKNSTEQRTLGENERYFLRGIEFGYQDGRFHHFTLQSEVFDLSKTEVKPRVGLTSTGASLTLPCSASTFESVFGKAAKEKWDWNTWH